MSPRTLIADVRLLDPASGLDETGGLLFEGDRIIDLGPRLRPNEARAEVVLDGDGLALIPGLIDMRVVVGEPGAEHKETLKSAGRSAAAGGVTTMVVMPNTNPIIDDVSLVEFIKRRGQERARVRALPCGALTKHLDGALMTEIGLLTEAGAVMFSNGDRPIVDTRVLRRALAYASAFGALVAHRPEDAFLAEGGVAHQSELSARMGLRGIPAEAELVCVHRDVTLAEVTGGRLLLDMVSTAGALDSIAAAKARGVGVHASVTVQHLALNELEVADYRTFAKLSPPLRAEADRRAIVAGVAAGTIDVIVSGHDPQPAEEKRLPFSEATAGASALETLLPGALGVWHAGEVELLPLLAAMTINPARLLGLPQGRLAVGAPADLTLVDLGAPFRFSADAMRCKCKNSPFDGRLMQGVVKRTIVAGQTVFEG
jgi:dihydroorotase